MYWANQNNSCCFLDNHGYKPGWQQDGCLVAVGSSASLKCSAGDALYQFQAFVDIHKGQWMFGHLSYDLKNGMEKGLSSNHNDAIQFPDLHFFIPTVVIQLSINEIVIEDENDFPALILQEILSVIIIAEEQVSKIISKQQITKEAYIDIINKLRQHILRGDCYEINFCQTFFAENATINPVIVYNALVDISPNPFACFYKVDETYLLCASPERYLMKNGQQIVSQPIKGTASRILNDKNKDEAQKIALQNNSKERSENVMVVDIVRNDFSKICKTSSVKVDELFGIYTYPQLHQMISTISGNLKKDISFTDILKATFPMGSMTGAPKLKVMQLIEQYEQTKRGLFSGSVGYMAPNGDFDFNVVIRSILYNHQKKYLSYQVGSGITFYSDAEKEYEECMLKAQAIVQVLNDK